MSSKQAIAFDLGNVLVRLNHQVLVRELGRESGLPGWLLLGIFKLLPFGDQYECGSIGSEAFLKWMNRLCLGRCPLDVIEKAWTGIFLENPGMMELVNDLRSKVPLFIISDTNPLHFEYLMKHYPFIRGFDGYILSYQVGVKKPHPTIFKDLCEKAKTTPENIFYTDDREDLITAASKLGFDAVLFTGLTNLKLELRKRKLIEPDAMECQSVPII